MIRSIILLFLFSICALNAQRTNDLEERMNELTESKKTIGITAGYAVNGEIVWSNAVGYSCKKGKKNFKTNTLTRIASISKPFTAVAVMQLVEKGLIDLDAPIEEYLPKLPNHKKNISLRQLLGHTASISQYYGKKEFENKIYYPTLQDAMEVFINRKPKFEPGLKYQYSSYGYVVIGRIIEEVSGMSFDDYMKTNIFDVAGMTNTGVENSQIKYENTSCLYHKKRKKGKKTKANDLSNRVPGGGFYSTLEDVIKFGNALLDETLTSRESLELMKAYQAVEYDSNKYGLGFYLYAPSPNEGLVIGHGGAQTGCTSQLLIVPKTKTVSVVLSNTSNNSNEVFNLASEMIRISEEK